MSSRLAGVVADGTHCPFSDPLDLLFREIVAETMSDLASAVRALPHRPGVYCFRDCRGGALYVGRAGDLRRRVTSYWGPLDDRPHLRSMTRRVRGVDISECRTEHEAAFLERDLITELDPPFNRSYGA